VPTRFFKKDQIFLALAIAVSPVLRLVVVSGSWVVEYLWSASLNVSEVLGRSQLEFCPLLGSLSSPIKNLGAFIGKNKTLGIAVVFFPQRAILNKDFLLLSGGSVCPTRKVKKLDGHGDKAIPRGTL
jgi:hypothetical protein